MIDQMNIRRSPIFKGRFFTFSVSIFVNQEKRFENRFLVFSSGKREAVINYLWCKHVWDQLPKIEFELMLLLLRPQDYKKWSFLKLQNEFSKKELRKKLLLAEHELEGKMTTRQMYLGIKDLGIEIQKDLRNLSKTKKFSGYIKSLSSRGKSKGGEKGIEPLSSDPSTYIVDEDQNLLWEHRLRPSLD
jgi:hypothetical protein